MKENSGETKARESLKNPNPDELVDRLVNAVNLINILTFQFCVFSHFFYPPSTIFS